MRLKAADEHFGEETYYAKVDASLPEHTRPQTVKRNGNKDAEWRGKQTRRLKSSRLVNFRERLRQLSFVVTNGTICTVL